MKEPRGSGVFSWYVLQKGRPPPPDLFVLSATEGKVAAMPNRSGGVGLRLICCVVERLGLRCAATRKSSRDAGLRTGGTPLPSAHASACCVTLGRGVPRSKFSVRAVIVQERRAARCAGSE